MNSYVRRALRATPFGVSEYINRFGATVVHFTHGGWPDDIGDDLDLIL